MVIDMADRKMVRQLDGTGRVVIPAEVREAMGLREGDDVEFSLHASGARLKKVTVIVERGD